MLLAVPFIILYGTILLILCKNQQVISQDKDKKSTKKVQRYEF